jgi:hypothetical protein
MFLGPATSFRAFSPSTRKRHQSASLSVISLRRELASPSIPRSIACLAQDGFSSRQTTSL